MPGFPEIVCYKIQTCNEPKKWLPEMRHKLSKLEKLRVDKNRTS